MTEEKARLLLAEACKAREHSYSPYSGFSVGAALLRKDGSILHGCNVENASYGGTICAERTAIVKSVSEGNCEFEAIAVVGGDEVLRDFCPPCGMCLQVMAEFCDPEEFFVILGRPAGALRIHTLKELLPMAFA